jgi:UDP-3-O-acyl-N-acetylglucosamine deacetylase
MPGNVGGVDEQRVVNQEGLRFPDEFVRHKLLDCVGDLSLFGVPVIGHLVAYKPGHRLCPRLLRALDAAGDATSLIMPGTDGRNSESVHSESSPGEQVAPAVSATLPKSRQGDRS